MTSNKQELRQILLKQRRSLSEQVWRHKSDRLVHRLQSLPLFREAQTILAYFSFRQEPDLSSLFNSNSNSNRRWGFPRCVGKSLIWHIWKPGDSLQTGAYGILEPPSDSPQSKSSRSRLNSRSCCRLRSLWISFRLWWWFL